jgi:hypothetical protein
VENVGLSFERRRPRTAAEEEEGAAGVGMGICNSGGWRDVMTIDRYWRVESNQLANAAIKVNVRRVVNECEFGSAVKRLVNVD